MPSGSDGRPELLGRRLRAARESAFVGREEELALFGAALYGSRCSVLYVHGPGGIGKSALLRRFAQEAALAGRSVVRVDGRTLDPSPAAFEAAAGAVLRDDRAVLLVDTFERIQGLEGWLRERFLPRLPVGALVVVAGRFAPDVRWRTDPGWAQELEVIPLRDLPPDDARALVDCCGVADELREPLLAFAGGHPLALLLGAAVAVRDEGAGTRWTPDHDVVATLLDQLVGEPPSAAHRHALEICAHAYMTTEELLGAALPEDAGPLFGWLRRLPFVESSSAGLYPHDVVREVLEADLRWRDPRGYAEMHDRIHAYLAEKVRTAAEPDVLSAVTALFHLHRGDNAIGETHSWYEEGRIQESTLRPEDTGRLVRLAHAAEGGRSAACAEFWLARQPSAVRVYWHTETGEPVAFSAWLRLLEPGDDECAADPVVAAAWEHALATAPPRAGEHLAVGRSWVLPAYRGDSPVTDLLQWRVIGNCLRARRMAWSYLAVRRPSTDRTECFRRHGMRDLPDAARVGDESYTMFVHDWREVPPQAWLGRLGRAPEPVPYVRAGRLAVLSKEEFDEAIRQALRHLPRPAELANSPLTRTRLVAQHGDREPAQVLRRLLETEIESLREDPRSVKSHRALVATYLKGLPTQEVAAERLGLPFTTYRRHLTAGIERVCDNLWQQELRGAEAAHPR
ncbi:ATP-binding protein [[Actinomadura] parvosata]|uniref:ATP-binding protein n=1 Tax=[Actinomadura] parvosata TaxID=1955412 RepID=UPI00406C7E89